MRVAPVEIHRQRDEIVVLTRRIRKNMRASLSAVVAAAVTLTCPPCLLTAQQRPAPPAATQVKLMTPFQSGSVGVGVAIAGRGSGECFARSIASSGRPDAWRCTIGNAVQDPCFQNALGDPNVLACARAPWTADVTLLTLTKPLVASTAPDLDVAKATPWALELANGQRCTLLTGATAPIAGMRINYGCAGGGIVVGDIDRSRPVWRAFAQGNKSLSLDLSDIAVAWY